jgi:superoxide dismutase, Cu-Zn family
MVKRLLIVTIVSLMLFAGTAYAQENPFELVAALKDAQGTELGTVSIGTITVEMARDMQPSMEELEGSVAIWVMVRGLTPGFHGLHIHSVGICDPSGERAFASARGHLHADSEGHGLHMGDLPSLLVTESGVAMLIATTDRFALEDLMDEDGSAVIIHAGADNFGNIPADRYEPDADETTLNTGDAGARAACGVIEASG